MMTRFDGVFMDMYGTLTAGDRAAVEMVCATIIRDTGIELSPSKLSVAWGEKFLRAVDYHNDGNFLTLFEIEVQTLRETMAAIGIVDLDPVPYVKTLVVSCKNPPLQPEVRSFLANFCTPICIVSNTDRADVDQALALHDIQVTGVVTSEDSRSYKPNPRIFEDALEFTGWRREHVIHVGDSLYSDVGGAIRAGICSGWVNRANRIYDIGTHRPDHEFTDLNDLHILIESVNG